MNKAEKALSHERLLELLDYDPNTGYFTWKVNRRGGKKAGDRAGNVNKVLGYVVIGIDCKGYYGHRLAWFYMNGVWPENQVDHKDLDHANNAYENLREATKTQQRANQRVRVDSEHGIKGVKIMKNGRFRVRAGGSHVGTYDTIEEAHSAYQKKAVELYGEFARFE